MEGEKAEVAAKKIAKAAKTSLRLAAAKPVITPFTIALTEGSPVFDSLPIADEGIARRERRARRPVGKCGSESANQGTDGERERAFPDGSRSPG